MSKFKQPNYAEIQALDDKLGKLKFRRFSVSVDGNCFFHAVVRQLELKFPEKQCTHEELRLASVEYLEQNDAIGSNHGESWKNFLNNESGEDYLSRMRLDAEWVDHILIQAAASCLKCIIVIISSIGDNIVSIHPKILDPSQHRITLGHIAEYHYFSAESEEAGEITEVIGAEVKSLWDSAKLHLGSTHIKSSLKPPGKHFSKKKPRFAIDDEPFEKHRDSLDKDGGSTQGAHYTFPGKDDNQESELQNKDWAENGGMSQVIKREQNMDDVLTAAFGDDSNSAESKTQKSEKEENPWDQFKSFPSEDLSEKDEQMFNFFTKVAKYFSVFIFGGTVLLASICSKSSLLVIANYYSQDYSKETACDKVDNQPYFIRYHAMLMLMVCLCFPDVLTFVYSIYRLIMKNEKAEMNWRFCIAGMIPEIFNAVGLTFLVVKVVPSIDATLATLMFSLIAFIPSVIHAHAKYQSFKKYIGKRGKKNKQKEEPVQNQDDRKRSLIFSIITLILQPTGYVLLSWEIYNQVPHDGDTQNWSIMIYAVCSLFLISFRYWENFVSSDLFGIKQTKKSVDHQRKGDDTGEKKPENVEKVTKEHEGEKYLLPLLNIQKTCDQTRFKTSIIYSVVRIGFIVFFCFIIHFVINGNKAVVFQTHATKFHFKDYPARLSCLRIINPMWYGVLTHCICALLAFFFGRVACQTRAQILGYSCPLVLVTPIMSLLTSVYTMYGAKYGITLMDYFFLPVKHAPLNDYIGWKTTLQNLDESWKIVLIVVVGLFVGSFSLFFLTFFMWEEKFRKQLVKMERTEALFVKPIYGGPLINEELMLNRRQYIDIYRDRVKSEVMKDTKDRDDWSRKSSQKKKKRRNTMYNPRTYIPQVFLCATMWHETEQEMTQLLTSIMRLDKHQGTTDKKHDDYFNFQVHVLFDDAMEWAKKKVDEDSDEYEVRLVPNKFVHMLVNLISVAAKKVNPHSDIFKSSETGKNKSKLKPVIYPTPYGGRIEFVLEYGNLFHIHLKDNDKIRNRKRWSQCMYMYYILGYLQETKKAYSKDDVFLLALDGDVDFQPKSLIYLLDRMKKNPEVGAACGRIHPIGNGPVVWFQKFEYAVGHWLQKSAEHVIGCVLCSPGCFSLFRGEALMDVNVVHRYTTRATEATHYIQWDQGEDRWLCTLLLKRGWRIEYAAISDSYTYAPEEFKEFYNQRRRWGPSTMANVFDILMDSKLTIRNNNYISRFYIAYQMGLMASTLLGPATVVLVVQGAFAYVFGMSQIGSLMVAIIPVIVFIILCYTTSQDFQIAVAGILTIVYALVMMAVLVGIIGQMTETLLNPNSIFMLAMIFIYAFTGIIHPTEMMCLLHGLLYYLCVPSAFILLMVYSLCNMNNVSWGTREVKKDIADSVEASQNALKAVANKNKPKVKRSKSLQLGPSVYDAASTSEGYYSCGLGNLCQCALCINPTPAVGLTTKQNASKKEDTPVVETVPGARKSTVRQPVTGVDREAIRKYSVHKSIFMGQPDGDSKALEKKLNNRSISVSQLRYLNDNNQNIDDAAALRMAMRRRRESKRKMSRMHEKTEKLAKELKAEQQQGVRRKITGVDSGGEDDDEELDDFIQERQLDEEKEGLDWIIDGPLEDGAITFIDKDEHKFWKQMIEKYLAPLKEDKEDKKRIQSDLITLRNKMTGAYFLINSLWIVLTFSLTLAIQDINITFNDRNGNEIVLQPLSFLFLIFFLVILLIQFVTMLIHRWSTFVHLMAATVIGNEENDKNNAKTNTIPNQSTSKKVDGKKNKKKKSKKLSVEDVNETIGSGVENRAFDSNFSTKTPHKHESLRMKRDGLASISPAHHMTDIEESMNTDGNNRSKRRSSEKSMDADMMQQNHIQESGDSFSFTYSRRGSNREGDGGNYELKTFTDPYQNKRESDAPFDPLGPVDQTDTDFGNSEMGDQLDAAMVNLTSQQYNASHVSDSDKNKDSQENTVF
ncbi:uncharacterized protein LOC120345701 [Styela clava]